MWLRNRNEEAIELRTQLEELKDARDAAVSALRQEVSRLRLENGTLRNRLATIASMAAQEGIED